MARPLQQAELRHGSGVREVPAVRGGRKQVVEDAAAELIARVVQEDAEAFRILVSRHHAKVFRLVQGILDDWHHAEDVCQEIFTTVYRKLPGFRCQSMFSTWLYRVSVNAAVKARRRWRRHEPKPLEFVGDRAMPQTGPPEFEGLEAFTASEQAAAREPLAGGPFKPFLAALHRLQQAFPASEAPIRTALVTARSAPAHERVIRTLRAWDIRIDESIFLGGMNKTEFLRAYQADVFFDDQQSHCESASPHIATGHVPHGVANS